MAEETEQRRGLAVNPTLINGALVIPAPEVDVASERRIAEQLAAMTRRGRLATAWRWWADFSGLAVVALSSAFLAVWFLSANSSVVTGLSDPRPISTVVHPGGQLIYEQDLQRLQACPGEVVETFFPAGDKRDATRPTEMIEQRRAAQNMTVKVFPNLRQTVQVPASLSPGRWQFTFGLDSHCPNRERVDKIATFEIEVQP